jgi:hypothetical protein
VVLCVVLSDIEVSSKEDGIPQLRRMRQSCGGGSTVSGPPRLGQQAPGASTEPQPDPMTASTALGGFDGSESASIVREVLAIVAVAEKAADTWIAEEAMAVKVAEEAATAKVATHKAVSEKVAPDKAVVMNAAKEDVA